MPYFLVVYDQHAGELLELTRYEAAERDDALSARFAREVVERDRSYIEVVLLGAASEDALRRTHARYFQTAAEIAATG
jgi:hypothetical protein